MTVTWWFCISSAAGLIDVRCEYEMYVLFLFSDVRRSIQDPDLHDDRLYSFLCNRWCFGSILVSSR
jgi:hypothetical protein